MKLTKYLHFDSESNSYSDLKNSLEKYSKWILLTDDNTNELCADKFLHRLKLQPFAKFSILPGEDYKNLWQVEKLYNFLLEAKLDRHSAVVNLGGGIVSDIGGYVSATFKRGIDYFNVPTTLLAMVDASFGGKTGINLNGVKNQIGIFYHPIQVLFDESFLKTLSNDEVKSGYGEIIKHSLISSVNQWDTIKSYCSISEINSWTSIIENSVKIKTAIVQNDPFEKSGRKMLNFGHTIGHAIETFFSRSGRQISHGHAIAIGMIIESKISVLNGLLDNDEFLKISKYIGLIFENPKLSKENIPLLFDYMAHDKKNENDNINFTLLSEIGKGMVDQTASIEIISKAIEYYIESD